MKITPTPLPPSQQLVFIKFDFDGSLKNLSAIGCFIVHDYIGSLLRVRVTYYGNTSILMVEVRALCSRLGLGI